MFYKANEMSAKVELSEAKIELLIRDEVGCTQTVLTAVKLVSRFRGYFILGKLGEIKIIFNADQ